MLTVDFDRLGVRPGMRLLDVGCGGGRHAAEAARRGAGTVAVDSEGAGCKEAASLLAGMEAWAVNGDALALPFPAATFDRVIAAEVLEHVPDDRAAMAELARVLVPGGRLAVTVPRWFPERVCWALSDGYHAPAVPGGHVRIYRRSQLAARLEEAGLRVVASHHAHALHTPYWWLRCAVGVADEDAPLVRRYHRFLCRQMFRPRGWAARTERTLDPVLGKSLVLYLERTC